MIGHDGMQLIEEICQIYSHYPELETEVLAASVRHPLHIKQIAEIEQSYRQRLKLFVLL